MSSGRYVLNFLLFSCGAVVLAVVMSFLSFAVGFETEAGATDASGDVVRIIIDAGHGAEDGGAVGALGVLEKDLNLDIAVCLASMLNAAGYDVVMTRTEDRLLCTEEERASGHRKQGDLKGRLEFIPDDEDAIFISIHMNSYPESYVHGAQIYYSNNVQSSAVLASSVREKLVDTIGEENVRKNKAADSSIFLLDRAKCTALLIECGFVSNFDECKKLCEKDYQKELCFSLFCAIMEYINDTNTEEMQ